MFDFFKTFGRGRKNELGETTIAQLVQRFDDYAKGRYSRNGKTTDRYAKYCAALRFLKPFHDYATDAFTDGHLRDIQQTMTKCKPALCRDTINTYVSAIKTVFQWGTQHHNLVSAHTYTQLLAVRGLKKGDGRASDSAGIDGVSDAIFVAIVAKIREPHKSILTLQRLTGARPGEIVRIRPCDIDKRGSVWLYRPAHHKLSHLNLDRVIALGSEAQDVLASHEPSNPTAWYFSNKERPYTVDALRQAIRRVAEKHSLATFNPNQIRHTVATMVREELGIDAAQSILGHHRIETTQRYAKLKSSKVAEVVTNGVLSLKHLPQKPVSKAMVAISPQPILAAVV